jgi:glutamate/aspartate transport system substrate-binding protein
MLRKDDPQFKALVDGVISGLYQSGEINKIYAQWFEQPIPPRGVNLHWPMSAALKRVIAKPTDSGDPAAYGAN